VLTFMAAIHKPDLFSQIILLDSPVFGRFRSHLLQLAKQLRFIDKVTPAHRAKVRRQEWANYQEAILYFKTKKLFENFAPACLEDYVRYGTVKTAQGIKLQFNHRVEYQIFRTLPHHLVCYRGQLKVPAALIYGNKSVFIKPDIIANMKKYF